MLCLHGYGQNAAIFNERLQTFRSKIKNKVEFLIPDAPFCTATGAQYIQDFIYNPDKYTRAWYHYPSRFLDKNDTLDVKSLFQSLDELSPSKDFSGLEESMMRVKEILDTNPAIRYIMGFSQGASLLAMMVQKGLIDKEKKLIFISGSSIKMADDVKFPHASYHIMGKIDKVVSGVFSLRLAKHFEKSTAIVHEGGHVCPRITASVLDAL